MNKIQKQLLENHIKLMVETSEYIPTALIEALDTSDNLIVDDILNVLNFGAYFVPDEMVLSIDSIDVILDYAKDVKLDMTLGFGSYLESYVISELGFLLKEDLLEMI